MSSQRAASKESLSSAENLSVAKSLTIAESPSIAEAAKDTTMAEQDPISQDNDEGCRSTTAVEGSEKKETPQQHSQPQQSNNKQLLAVVPSSLLVVFLVALDRSIVSTAIPRITDEFNSLNDIGWYGSAYLLTASCFQLLAGRIYTFYPAKYIFMLSITLFEIGSAVCGAAPSSVALIIGRAIAGLGCAGIQNGGIAIILPLIPLPKRPVFQGCFGAMLGIGNVLGPLIGGALTTGASWRWCFYINLPAGGLALLIISFAVQVKPPSQPGLTAREKLQQLDILGEFFLVPSLVCLLLALQWGGSTYPWNDARMIALLVIFGACFLAFVLVQILMQKTATVPGRVVRNRSIISALWVAVCNGAVLTIMLYFIPIYFQAVKGTSAVVSGIHLIPMVLSMTIASLITGFMTKKFGYYTPFAIACSVLASVGAGLISTWKVDTPMGTWIGFQIVFGFGIGMGLQQPNLTAQTVLEGKDVQIGFSLMLLMQFLGGAIFVSVGQSVLESSLINNLKNTIQGITPADVIHTGATELRTSLPTKDLSAILFAYDKALSNVFIVATCMACLSFLGAVTLEWRSVKGKQGPTVKKRADEEVGSGELKDDTT